MLGGDGRGMSGCLRTGRWGVVFEKGEREFLRRKRWGGEDEVCLDVEDRGHCGIEDVGVLRMG